MKMSVNSNERIQAHVMESGSREPAGSTIAGTFDHKKLKNRDKADQHPISAITELQDELDTRPDSALTNLEIEEALSNA